jgi:hypothetical protein
MNARVVVLVVVAATGACTAAPPGLQRVWVRNDLQTNRLHVVPGERYAVVETAGPGPLLLVWDETLRQVACVHGIGDVGVARDGTRLLRMHPYENEVLELPSLRAMGDFPDPAGWSPLSYWGVRCRPSGDGWAAISWDGVLRIEDGPPRAVAVGHPQIGRPIGSAIDDATGLLVMIGDRNLLETFDLDSMKSVFVAELPCREVSFDVAAGGGTAWVGTRDGDGSFLEFDLRARTVRRHELGQRGDVQLSMSDDHSELAVVADQFVPSADHPALLKVFRCGHRDLEEIASLSVAVPGGVFDVAILPKWGTVLLAGPQTFAWRYAPNAAK